MFIFFILVYRTILKWKIMSDIYIVYKLNIYRRNTIYKFISAT